METTDYQNVISIHDIRKFPISMTTTEVNLTGSWRFFKPVFNEKISPCSVGCPASTNIPKCIYYVLKNDLKKAAEIWRNENPFPATCGRVCPHFCQEKCNRNNYDGAVQIREIEKFIGDYALNLPYGKPDRKVNKKVAVIGSGPAGLSCSYFLAKNGYSVTIYEKEGFLGGILKYGIPPYRLPKEIVDKEINNILEIGNIDVRLNEEITKEMIEKISSDYDAVFIGIGLNKNKIPENIHLDEERIISGYEFLREFNTDKNFVSKFKGEKIAVVGGGNVAFDVARTVLRLGNSVDIVCVETLQEAPSFEDEKIEGIEEGLNIRERRVIDSIEESNKLKLTLREVKSFTDDIIETTDYTEQAEYDRVIIAIGRDRDFLIEEQGNIFFGGDYANGAKTVIEAIASGKANAFKIMKYLKDAYIDPQIEESDNFLRTSKDFGTYSVVPFEKINLFYFKKQEPLKVEKLSAEKRSMDFREINLRPSLDKILNEAKRCFSCGVCNSCKTCWFFCPDACIKVGDNVDFDYQYCKGCGVCSAECPRGVIDMVEDK